MSADRVLCGRRDLREIDRLFGHLLELRDELRATPAERLSGSRRWREDRRLDQVRGEIDVVEAELIRALGREFAGYVLFSPVPGAQPRGKDLLALALDLRERDARGELPLPTVR
jgi:hypothetical protein